MLETDFTNQDGGQLDKQYEIKCKLFLFIKCIEASKVTLTLHILSIA